MILIGRGLDLGEEGKGNREKGKGEAESEAGRQRGRRNLEPERPEPKTSEEMVCGRMSEERLKAAMVRRWKGTPTCAVLRVRGKAKGEASESGAEASAKRERVNTEAEPNNPIFPVTIA